MKGFYTVLLSHGNYAIEALKSAEMIMGKMTDFSAIGLFPGMGSDDLEEALETELAAPAAKSKEKVLILTDVPYGTPSNVSLHFAAKNPKVTVISGFNLPLVINAYDCDDISEITATMLIKESSELMKVVSQTVRIARKEAPDEEDL
ncbi:PTS sugar transporter subunit IIA [Caproiciproducens sp. R1]|uniref:PTS sugar transporter subunit IIA n=1 Tax=Caproiciproducens sp. R1 TaxID=3435000 RepID=UPI00403455EE